MNVPLPYRADDILILRRPWHGAGREIRLLGQRSWPGHLIESSASRDEADCPAWVGSHWKSPRGINGWSFDFIFADVHFPYAVASGVDDLFLDELELVDLHHHALRLRRDVNDTVPPSSISPSPVAQNASTTTPPPLSLSPKSSPMATATTVATMTEEQEEMTSASTPPSSTPATPTPTPSPGASTTLGSIPVVKEVRMQKLSLVPVTHLIQWLQCLFSEQPLILRVARGGRSGRLLDWRGFLGEHSYPQHTLWQPSYSHGQWEKWSFSFSLINEINQLVFGIPRDLLLSCGYQSIGTMLRRLVYWWSFGIASRCNVPQQAPFFLHQKLARQMLTVAWLGNLMIRLLQMVNFLYEISMEWQSI